MASPSLNLRARHLHAQLDELLGWSAHLPRGRMWAERFNELRFIRGTLAWEEFLEETFVCYLCGSPTVLGRTQSLKVVVAKSAAIARNLAVGSGTHFGKWLNEDWTLRRAAAVFSGTSHPYLPLANPTFPHIRKVRNRIVHRSDVSRTEFQSVVRVLYGSARPGMTPGRLLTDLAGGIARIDRYLQFLKIAGSLIVN